MIGVSVESKYALDSMTLSAESVSNNYRTKEKTLSFKAVELGLINA